MIHEMMKPNVKTLKFLSAELWCCLSEAKLYRVKCFLPSCSSEANMPLPI